MAGAENPKTSAENSEKESSELLEDGQEEVFSRTAVEHGIVKDPNAMGPVDGCA